MKFDLFNINNKLYDNSMSEFLCDRCGGTFTKETYARHLKRKILCKNINSFNVIETIYINNKDIRKNLSDYLISSEKEKKLFDEYLTPASLVDELIYQIPKEFFYSPKKVFEPCAGKGNILLALFDAFFIGLEDYCNDVIERCRIIIEECLYFADINDENINFIKKILIYHIQSYSGITLDYKMNYYCGDSLLLKSENIWNVKHFDCIISNPPFNVSQKYKNKKKRGGGNSLWKKFILKSINEWLIIDGYMIMIHPSGWRKPGSSGSKYDGLFKLLAIDNQMIYLNMNSHTTGTKVFNCSTNFDWYIIQKRESYQNTTVCDYNDNIIKINMKDWKFLPNYNIKKVSELLCDKETENCNILYDRSNYGGEQKWVQKIKDNKHVFPLIHSTPKKGPVYYYSSRDDNGHFKIGKVIFGDSGINSSILDIEGKYGMTHHAMALIDEEKYLASIKDAIDSKEFTELLRCCSWSNYQIDWRLFLYLRRDFWKYIHT